MKIVFDNHGLVKAGLSAAFLIDFIPGVVMSLLFGQLASLALPIRAVLGDEYSPKMVASQFEELVVSSNKTSAEDWTDVDADITAEKIVDGLFLLKVPSLSPFIFVLPMKNSHNNALQMAVSAYRNPCESDCLVRILQNDTSTWL